MLQGLLHAVLYLCTHHGCCRNDSRRHSRSTFQYIFTEIGDPLKRQEVDQMLRDFNAVDESDDVLYPLVVHKLLEI